MPGPLDGIKVVDFSQVVSGPFCSMLLADQGADVIKVEPLIAAGDMTRGLPTFTKNGFPALYLNNNRGKRSLGVDLSSDEGREIALDLCAEADIVLENFRPGAMTRLGLDYDAVAAIKPDIIYCSISGFGPTGPYADRPVLDPVIQGLTGIVARQLNPQIPFPDLVRNLIADKSTSFTAAQAITAALFVRERTGDGQNIVVPMLDSALYFFWPDGMMDKTVIDDDATPGFLIASVYTLTECADGKIVYFVATDPMITALFAALGHPEWRDDERFASVEALAGPGNFEALGELIADSFLELSVDDALARLIEHDVPCGPILEPDQVLVDPQVVHNKIVQQWQHPEAGTIQQAAPAARFSKTPSAIAASASARGADNAEILSEIGRTPDQIASLQADGIIGG